jgi:integrase
MTPPIWLDAAGRPRPTRACWTCGREVPVTRLRAEHLRPHRWQPGRTLHIPGWCGCSPAKPPTCPGRTPHDLRRTAVRNLERAGVLRSVAMKMVGHKTEAIYRGRYAIGDEAMLREGAEKLARNEAAAQSLTAR